MPRFTWGPDFALTLATDPAQPAPVAPAKADVELVFVRVDPVAGTITLQLPAYDPATHLQPDSVHALLFAPGAAVPIDASDAMTDSLPKSSVDLSPAPGGCEITLPRPDGAQPGVQYTGKTVLQFGS